MKRFLLNLSPDSAEGGEPTATPPPPEGGTPNPAPPPATKIVVEGTKTEREIELERKLADTEAAKRKAETDASYHADEARKLREFQSAPPITAPVKPKRVRSFMGFTQEVED